MAEFITTNQRYTALNEGLVLYGTEDGGYQDEAAWNAWAEKWGPAMVLEVRRLGAIVWEAASFLREV